MEAYKKTIESRIRLLSAALLLMVSAVVYLRFFFTIPDMNVYHEILTEVAGGLLTAGNLIAVILVFHYRRALHDEYHLKKLYYNSQDERKKMIRTKTGGPVMLICAILIFIGGLIGGFFNIMIFYCLLGCSFFLITVQAAMKLYYLKKF